MKWLLVLLSLHFPFPQVMQDEGLLKLIRTRISNRHDRLMTALHLANARGVEHKMLYSFSAKETVVKLAQRALAIRLRINTAAISYSQVNF